MRLTIHKARCIVDLIRILGRDVAIAIYGFDRVEAAELLVKLP